MNRIKNQLGGFSLVEILVVIALVGVLSGSLYVFINPREVLDRARDAKRKNSIESIGRAMQSYSAVFGSLPQGGLNWMQQLVDSGDLTAKVAQVDFSEDCNTSIIPEDNKYCYTIKNGSGYIFSYITSDSALDACHRLGYSPQHVLYVYGSDVGKACMKCTTFYGACDE